MSTTDKSVLDPARVLEQNPDVFHILLETMSCAVFVAREGFLYVNPAAAEISGYTQDELLAMPQWSEMIHPDDRERVVSNGLARLRGEPVANRYQFRILQKNGEACWIDYTADRIIYDGQPAVLGTAFDITEAKVAEEKIRESEHELAGILENMQDTYYRTDAEGKLIHVSPSLKALLDYSPEEVLGHDLADYYFYPELRNEFLEQMKQNGGVVVNQETIMRHRNGNPVYVLTNAHFCYDENNNFVGVEGTTRDITERKQVELALQESEARFRDIADNIPGGVFQILLRPDGHITFPYISETMASLSGTSPKIFEDDPEQAFQNLFGERSREAKDALTRAALDLNTWTWEFSLEHDDTELVWLRISSSPRLLKDKSVLWNGVMLDITDLKLTENALRNSEERFSKTFRSTPAMICIVTQDEGRFIDVNEAFLEVFGYTREELIGKTSADLGIWQNYESRKETVRQIEQQGALRGLEFPFIAKNGDVLQLYGSVEPIQIDDEKCLLMVAQDITEKKLAEAALHREKELAQVTLASIGDGVVTTDTAGHIEYMNAVAEELSGWKLRDAKGCELDQVLRLIDESTHNPIASPIAACLVKGMSVKVPRQPLLIRKDGQAEYSLEITAAPIKGRDGKVVGAVLVFHDVTGLIGMARQLSYQATHDDLTSLVNRREFEDRLEHALLEAKSKDLDHVMCYLDLDQFKVVNDTCGHSAGDELLKQISGELQRRMRDNDTLARLGGDEFGILMLNIKPEVAVRRIESIHERLRDYRFLWEDKVFEVGASVGLVHITRASSNLSDVLSAADSACYVAKDSGRNRIHIFKPDDTAIAKQRGEMEWLHRITRAFEEQRFMLYYQPIMPISERARAAGGHCEFLLRMIDESGKPVLPKGFISAAERYQLMPTIDRWVIRTALQALAREEVRKEIGVSTCAINLSGQSFSDEAFLKFVVEQIEQSSVDPHQVCFEITETAAIANLGRAMAFIHTLKGLGCRFSLDDFGRGLSSFGYLKDLPVDYLKIDGSFVRDLVHDPIDYAMVEAINQIGHVMNIHTIAESVETETALDLVRKLGVDYVQGTSLASPSPIASIAASEPLPEFPLPV